MSQPDATRAKNGLTYKDAGVDIDEGDALVEAIKPLARSTSRPGTLGGLGGFGALFDLKAAGFQDPILVSGTDGVGTKLKVAIESGLHSTVGIDLVAMCVNDLLVQGATPLFFLDYYATGQLSAAEGAAVVGGIAEGCRRAGCALIGGETAEMPGLYAKGDYDLAGFAVGAVERTLLLPKTTIAPGDKLIGLPSSGPHSNGYSLIRRIVEISGMAWDAPAPFSSGKTLAEALMEPTIIYVKPLLPLIAAGRLKAMAHITGGGLPGNLPRVLPDDVIAVVKPSRSFVAPPVFAWLMQQGGVAAAEMHRTFNCGVGMILVAAPDEAEAVSRDLAAAGLAPFDLGYLEMRGSVSDEIASDPGVWPWGA